MPWKKRELQWLNNNIDFARFQFHPAFGRDFYRKISGMKNKKFLFIEKRINRIGWRIFFLFLFGNFKLFRKRKFHCKLDGYQLKTNTSKFKIFIKNIYINKFNINIIEIKSFIKVLICFFSILNLSFSFLITQLIKHFSIQFLFFSFSLKSFFTSCTELLYYSHSFSYFYDFNISLYLIIK